MWGINLTSIRIAPPQSQLRDGNPTHEDRRMSLRRSAIRGQSRADSSDLLPLLPVPALARPRGGVHRRRPTGISIHGAARPEVVRRVSFGSEGILRRVRSQPVLG